MKIMKNNAHFPYILMVLLQSLVYGFGNPLTKIAYESITPFWLLTIRFTLATLLFLILGRKALSISRQRLKHGQLKPADILPAGLCMALAYITCNVALSLTSATIVGFMMSLSVVLAPLLAVFILKEKYDFKRLPLQLLVLAGVFLLYFDGRRLHFQAGDLICLFMAFFLAGSLVFGKRALQQTDAVTISTVQCALTAVISLICALGFDDLNVLKTIRPAAWLVILYLALFCTCLAYYFQNQALTGLSAAAVAALQCTQPLLTALAAYLLLGETLTALAWLGAAVIIGGILALNRRY